MGFWIFAELLSKARSGRFGLSFFYPPSNSHKSHLQTYEKSDPIIMIRFGGKTRGHRRKQEETRRLESRNIQIGFILNFTLQLLELPKAVFGAYRR